MENPKEEKREKVVEVEKKKRGERGKRNTSMKETIVREKKNNRVTYPMP